MTSEDKFTSELSDLLNIIDDDGIPYIDLDIKSISTFEEGMILTNNKGLTVTLKDRSQFQITIVKSRGKE